MAFQVLVTKRANRDLEEIVNFITLDNPPAARKFAEGLTHKIRLLRDHPLMGRVVPEVNNPVIREIIHRSYRIIYRVSEQEHSIEILRFWHGARGEPQASDENGIIE